MESLISGVLPPRFSMTLKSDSRITQAHTTERLLHLKMFIGQTSFLMIAMML